MFCFLYYLKGNIAVECLDLPNSSTLNDTSAVQSMQGTTQNDGDYDWVCHVASLPFYNAGRGWFRLVDIIPIMPLSMFCKLVGVTFEVKSSEHWIQ